MNETTAPTEPPSALFRPAYILFLAGVFASAATNLFTAIATTRLEASVTKLMALSASSCLVASILAFYLGTEIEALHIAVNRNAMPGVPGDAIDAAVANRLKKKRAKVVALWICITLLLVGAFTSGTVAHLRILRNQDNSNTRPAPGISPTIDSPLRDAI
jgi:hypothetical protein